jgi:hypothetical protein
VYNVPRKTLTRRLAGTKPRRDCTPNLRKLTDLEVEELIKHILNLDLRGFSPKLHEVADMANHLRASRGASLVGINWPDNLIQQKYELKIRLNRRCNYQRAKCEDPAIIKPWFDLVQRTILEYGILNHDIYNFDETGFQMVSSQPQEWLLDQSDGMLQKLYT